MLSRLVQGGRETIENGLVYWPGGKKKDLATASAIFVSVVSFVQRTTKCPFCRVVAEYQR